MDALNVLHTNYEAKNNSFLYYLHEENYFHEKAFSELCGCVSSLWHTHPHDKAVSAQITFLYGQVLRHIIYHFDPNDSSQIYNLPSNYNQKLEAMECIIIKYFSI